MRGFWTIADKPAGTTAMRDRAARFPAFRGAGRARRWAACCAVLALLPGCGAVASVGSTLYSTTEAIATAVKDAARERDEGPTDADGGEPERGGK